jgi:hypothetical protein
VPLRPENIFVGDVLLLAAGPSGQAHAIFDELHTALFENV